MNPDAVDDMTCITLLECVERGAPLDIPEMRLLVSEGLVTTQGGVFALTTQGNLRLRNLRSVLMQNR